MKQAKRREPPQKIPVTDDHIHALALDVVTDYEAAYRRRDSASGQASALAGLGYQDWIIGGQSYTAPETPRRREKVLQRLEGTPYHARLATAFGELGFNPPRRDAGAQVGPLRLYVRVAGGVAEWGLEESLRRDLALAKFDRLYLKVLDHGEVVYQESTSDLNSLVNSLDLAGAGLTDDDYRFEVGYEGRTAWGGAPAAPGQGFPRGGEWFDWAVVDGEWVELELQGHDWDGEYAPGAV